MKVAFCPRYGSPDFIKVQEVDVPVPGASEILVKVFAATVNRSDFAILKGSLMMRLFTGLTKPRKSITGTDFAGMVVKTGENVTGYRSGDRIFGFNDMGFRSHAEYLLIDEKRIFSLIPESISYEQAAASLEAAHYAINFINKVTINPGAKVMVNGGTGAIGSALVQFLKYLGAYVTATCRAENTDWVKSMGADKVIDFTRDDFTMDSERYDFVFDAVGKSTFGKCKRLLTDTGVYISSELGPYAQNLFLALITSRSKGKKVIFPVPVRLDESVRFIKDLLTQGKFVPLIDRRYKLDEVAEAFRYVGTGEKTGNVILQMVEPDR